MKSTNKKMVTARSSFRRQIANINMGKADPSDEYGTGKPDCHSLNIKVHVMLTSRIMSDTRGVLPQPALRAKKYLMVVNEANVQWDTNTTMLIKTHLASYDAPARNRARMHLCFLTLILLAPRSRRQAP